jgi:hypothetical protein
MGLNRPELLGIYLNDHLAGSAVGVEMARRSRGANAETEFGGPLSALCGEIEADRETLEAVIEELAVGRSRIKPTLGWLAEKVGRLKPNGQLRGYSPLSRVVELETLIVGVTGKLRLWLLGADYNVFLISRIWSEAESAELKPAIRSAGASAGRAITVAGLILALSFAAVMLIPIQSFREIGFALFIGLLLDTLIARTLLIPALVALFGHDSFEPNPSADLSPLPR